MLLDIAESADMNGLRDGCVIGVPEELDDESGLLDCMIHEDILWDDASVTGKIERYLQLLSKARPPICTMLRLE